MLELVRSKKWSTIRSISYLYEKYILCKSYPRTFGLHPSILSTWICYISRSVYHRHNFGSLLLRFVHFILATDTTMNNKYKGREISFPINVKIPFTRNPFRSKSLRFSRFPFVLGQPSDLYYKIYDEKLVEPSSPVPYETYYGQLESDDWSWGKLGWLRNDTRDFTLWIIIVVIVFFLFSNFNPSYSRIRVLERGLKSPSRRLYKIRLKF